MSAMALEAQKASLARDILCMEDEATIHNVWLFLKRQNLDFERQKTSGNSNLSIEGAYGIFKGIDTTFEREEEDRV